MFIQRNIVCMYKIHVLPMSYEYLSMYCTYYAHTYIIIKICIHTLMAHVNLHMHTKIDLHLFRMNVYV